jgi:hypothetical protein
MVSVGSATCIQASFTNFGLNMCTPCRGCAGEVRDQAPTDIAVTGKSCTSRGSTSERYDPLIRLFESPLLHTGSGWACGVGSRILRLCSPRHGCHSCHWQNTAPHRPRLWRGPTNRSIASSIAKYRSAVEHGGLDHQEEDCFPIILSLFWRGAGLRSSLRTKGTPTSVHSHSPNYVMVVGS